MISHFVIFILPYLEGLEQRGELWLLWGFYCFTFLTQLYSQTGFRSIYLSFIKTAAISTLFALIAAVNVIIVIIIYILFFQKQFQSADSFSKLNAGCLSLIIWLFVADYTVNSKCNAIVLAFFFPAAHPVAVSPSVGTEERYFLPASFGSHASNTGWNTESSSSSSPIAGHPKATPSKLLISVPSNHLH